MHELADKLNDCGLRQEQLQGQLNVLVVKIDAFPIERITHALDKVTDLSARMDEAKHQGAKYGGIVGGAIAFAGLVWQVLKS